VTDDERKKIAALDIKHLDSLIAAHILKLDDFESAKVVMQAIRLRCRLREFVSPEESSRYEH
jgi:hypothetical protein